MKIHTSKYRNIDCIVVTALLCAALTIQSFAQPKPKPPDQWILAVCIGVVVLVVGGCATYKLANFCDERFPRTNSLPRGNSTSHIVMQSSPDMRTWTTVFETNCYLDEFEYKPETNQSCAFYRVMFP